MIRQIKIPVVEDNQLAATVFWTLKREIAIDDQVMLDYDVEDTVEEGEGPRLLVTCYIAQQPAVEELKDLFLGAGIALTGITASYAAIRNVYTLHAPVVPGDAVAVFQMQADYSEIGVVVDDHLPLFRLIRTGYAALLEAMGRSAKTENGLGVLARQDLAGLEERELEGLAGALDRLIRQVDRTLDYFRVNLKKGAVARLLMAGPLTPDCFLVAYLQEHVQTDIQLLDVTKLPGAVKAGITQAAMPSLFAMSAGLALSEAVRTPNLLFSSEERQRRNRMARIRGWVSMIASGLLIAGLLAWVGISLQVQRLRQQGKQVAEKSEEIVRLFEPSEMDQQVAEAVRRQAMLRKTAARYLPEALVQELTALMPGRVWLVQVDMELGRPVQAARKKADRYVQLQGFVDAPQGTANALLAECVVRLEGSPLLMAPEVISAQPEVLDGRAVLFFSLRAEICPLYEASDAEVTDG
jgi:Tfp pilus assembly PilM family ATPase